MKLTTTTDGSTVITFGFTNRITCALCGRRVVIHTETPDDSRIAAWALDHGCPLMSSPSYAVVDIDRTEKWTVRLAPKPDGSG